MEDIIKQFDVAREWADITSCLQKIKKSITSFHDLHIPAQKNLAKKLAQCLNPELNVIH
jgi:hypothetical protein